MSAVVSSTVIHCLCAPARAQIEHGHFFLTLGEMNSGLHHQRVRNRRARLSPELLTHALHRIELSSATPRRLIPNVEMSDP